MSIDSFALKTRTTSIGISEATCPGRKRSIISGQRGLQVIVMKNVGFPSAAAIARPFVIFSCVHLVEPIKLVGRNTFSWSGMYSSPIKSASSREILRRLLRINMRRSSRTRLNISTKYSLVNRPNIAKRSSRRRRCRICQSSVEEFLVSGQNISK
jgi:hypothetical protein